MRRERVNWGVDSRKKKKGFEPEWRERKKAFEKPLGRVCPPGRGKRKNQKPCAGQGEEGKVSRKH